MEPPAGVIGDIALLRALFEQSPFSTVIYDAGGRLLAANAAFARLWGVGIDAAPPDYCVLEDQQLEAQGALAFLRRAFAGEAVVTPPVRYDMASVSTMGQGREVWTQAHVFPVRTEAGAISHVVLTHVDISDRIAANSALSNNEARARNLLSLATALSQAATIDEVADAMFNEGLRAVGADAGSLAIVTESESGGTGLRMIRTSGYSTEAADRFRQFPLSPGRPLSDAVISRTPVVLESLKEWHSRYTEMATGVMAAMGFEGYIALPIVIGERTVAGVSFSFRQRLTITDETRTFLATIGQLCAQALERARVFDRERRARDASQFLAEASRLLSASLDYETTMQNVATAAVPRFADWCAIDMLDAPGSSEWPPHVRRVALAHEDPDRIAWAERLAERLPTDWTSDGGLAKVLRRDVSEFIPKITDELLVAAATSPDQLEALRELHLRSLIIVPLIARARTLGALTLLMTESERAYDETDLAVAEDLGRRVATAIDNARLYDSALEARAASDAAAARTRTLQTLTADLARALTLEQIIDITVAQGILASGANAGTVMLLSEDGQSLSPVFALGYSDRDLELLRDLPIDSPYPTRDAARGTPVFLSSREEWLEAYARPVWSPDTGQAAASVPLEGTGRNHGVLSIRYAEHHEFDADEREFFITLGRQCGQAIERAYLLAAERSARAEAERANRAKMEFLATMSHELRTPLNAIGGYTELLQLGVRGPTTAEQQQDLERIQRSQQHLLSLINDVLNFARVEAGRVELQVAPVSVRDTIDAMEPLVAPQFGAKRVKLELGECDPAVRVMADDDKLRQILLNLLSNAVKFTSDGGRVVVSCNVDANRVYISVQDSGIGIAAEFLERIFDPFVQLERRLTNVVAGTGLGLAISRDLARAMHGDITVTSAPSSGSTFTVDLPRAD